MVHWMVWFSNLFIQPQRQRIGGEQRWKTHGDPSHQSKPRCQSTPPPQPLVLLSTTMRPRWVSLSLSLSFPNFIRLIRKNVFVVQIFRLCFCSNYGMLYFSTIEIKKHEREMNKEERRKEKDFFFFYSVGFFF